MKRNIRHWTPRYVVDRGLVAMHARRHPDDPWWTRDAVQALVTLLRATDECFEWGSGRSTKWLAARTAAVTSIEHDRTWFDRTAGSGGDVRFVSDGDEIEYAGAIAEEGFFDIIVVDGEHRGRCTAAALEHLRPGGILVIDNVERYLPNRSRSPQSIGEGYESPTWERVGAALHSWRRLWTTDGISDTALFLSPPDRRRTTD